MRLPDLNQKCISFEVYNPYSSFSQLIFRMIVSLIGHEDKYSSVFGTISTIFR